MTRQARLALKYGLPLLILAGAVGLTYYLISQREEPEREERKEQAVLVETMPVEAASQRLDVRASGTVIAAREVTVSPQVGGRLQRLHPNLVPGGIIQKGEVLARIDSSDYRIALKQRQTALEQAKAQLELEKGQQDVARKEWKLFKDDIDEDIPAAGGAGEAGGEDGSSPSALALRKPQLRSAQAQVEAAEAQLEKARLNLSRTAVEAPFDAFVLREQADPGQLVGSQSRIATLVGTDKFWVRLSVPADEIGYVKIPGVNAEKGSTAHITYDIGSQSVERTGEVVRLLGDLDPAGRMAQVLVEIKDPLGLNDTEKTPDTLRGVPLLLDAYVDVRLEGNTERELVELPRGALRNGDQAFVYADGILERRTLEIVWRRPDTVLVGEGIEDGDRVITSPIATPVDGMRLRIRGEKTATAETADADESGSEDTADDQPDSDQNAEQNAEQGADQQGADNE